MIFVSAMLLYSCSNQFPTPTNYKDVIITLDRGPCFGTCPVYKLVIFGNGTVIYNGSDFTAKGIEVVRVKGLQTTFITEDKVKQLVDKFQKINYFNLKDNYISQDYVDGKTVITSITINGRKKTIQRSDNDVNGVNP